MNLLYFAAELIDKSPLPQASADDTRLQTILNILFVTLGALAFLLLVIAGFRYVLAQGDPQKVASAKNMIIYTVVGLVVAASAAAIVNYVLGSVS